MFGSAIYCPFCWRAWPSLSLLSMFWKSAVRLGQLHKAARSVICGEASVGGCCTLKIMFTVKLKCGGSVMKRIEVKRTIQNSDFYVALQRKLIFFKVTCCLSLWLLRKPHLKLFSTEKKKKKVQLQWSVEQFGLAGKNNDRKSCESVYLWVSAGTYLR